MKNRIALAWLAAMATSLEPAQAQGTSCTTATPIQTTGQWSWYASGFVAQTPFSPGTDCEFRPGFIDYFFEWTAPTSGHFQIDTIGSTWDTQLAVYTGSGCSATCLAYDYRTGSISTNFFIPTSLILLPNVTAGDVFLIRVGGFPESHTPTDRLNITEYTDPCIFGIDDALESNNRYGDAIDLNDGTYANLWVSHAKPDHFSFCVAPGSTLALDLLFPSATGNVDAVLLDSNALFPDWEGQEIASGYSTTDDEHITWTNTGTTNARVVLRVYVNGLLGPSDCNNYDLVVTGGDLCQFTTSTFCDPMDVNSTGVPTLLTASASATSPTGVRLEASQGPPSQFAYLLVGSQSTQPGTPVGDGRFCMGLGTNQRFGRLNVWNSPMNSLGRFQPDGTLNNIVGTSGNGKGFDVPTTLPFDWIFGQSIHVVHGQTWHYQLWHREPNGRSNFSNGLSVSF